MEVSNILLSIRLGLFCATFCVVRIIFEELLGYINDLAPESDSFLENKGDII